MDFSSDSSWGWIQRIALILGALASLIVIVEFPGDHDSGPQSTPPTVERPAPPVTKPLPPEPEPTAPPPDVDPVTETVYRTTHGERYHRPNCHHIKGRDTFSFSITEAREQGLTPCRTCNPGQ